jgi:predicted dienelactone hydrolase
MWGNFLKGSVVLILLGSAFFYTNCSAPKSASSLDANNSAQLPNPNPAPAPVPSPAPDPGTCTESGKVGFTTLILPSGLPLKIWYPSSSDESDYTYKNNFAGRVAVNGQFFSCGKVPVVVFSHGLNGCSTQSTTFTEELARDGYIVVAGDHYDSTCVTRQAPAGLVSARFSQPEDWTEATYKDRYQDVVEILNYLLQDSALKDVADVNRIGIAGHSLGGYTSLGFGGAWPTWKDNRIKAVLGLSPYVEAYLHHNTISGLNIPVMYQGGTLDTGITPSLTRTDGAYNRSNAAKYLIVLKRAGHFDFSDAGCESAVTILTCLAQIENARLINQYGFAFLAKHLKGTGDQPLLRTPNSALQDLQYQE